VQIDVWKIRSRNDLDVAHERQMGAQKLASGIFVSQKAILLHVRGFF